MPRTRTHGERIQLQLPLEIDALIRQEANRNQMSPAQFLQTWIERRAREKLRSASQVADGACLHAKARIINGGLKHCDECGATRNMQGEWV